MRRQREDWVRHRIPAVSAQPERVVFIDETSVKTNLTRLRRWAPRGDRLVMDAPCGSWGTQTFIAGLTADAMIAPWVIKGAMDGPAVTASVEKVLAPELTPGTVVILDNLATHKNADAAKAMRDAECWVLFLPPDSPDLNPTSRDIACGNTLPVNDRHGLLETQGTPQADRRADLYRHIPSHRTGLRSLLPARLLELL